MDAASAGHWERLYQATSATQASWYEAVPRRSLELIESTGLALDAPILDVGGGASTLVDHLLTAGHTDLTVLDLAPAALAQARARLGPAAERVGWIAGDVTSWQPPRRYAVWHDRAVLHFLVSPSQQERYLAVLKTALAPGGHVVLATFGPAGPRRCSGLPVQRYSTETLGDLLGPGFRLRRHEVEDHHTPAGVVQQFLYTWWQGSAEPDIAPA